LTKDLEIDEVKKSDREEVEALCQGIWDGHDYIPELFDAWVEEGGFICGRVDDEIVALAKHTWHDHDVLWLEGLRVHPEKQGKGYGRKMIEKRMDYIQDLNYEVARFLTSGDRRPVRKIAEEMGFELKKEFQRMCLNEEELGVMEPPSEEEISGVEQEEKVEEVLEFVFSSPVFKDHEGLYVEGWTAYDMKEELIRDRIERGHCFSVRNPEIKALMFRYVDEIYGSVSIAFIAGGKEEMKKLLNHGLKEAIEDRRSIYRVKTASKKVMEAAQDVGLKYSDHGTSVVYEKKVDG